MRDSPLLSREERFRRLFDVMEGPVSRRWALTEVTGFLAELSGLGPEAEAYLLPLAGPLSELVGRLDPVGLRPEQLLRPSRLTGKLRRRLDLETNGPLARAERDLRRRAALLLAYGGAAAQAVQTVSEETVRPEDLPEASPRERLVAARRHLKDTMENPAGSVEEGLRWILSHWDRETGDNETLVPVVERLPAWARRNGRPDKSGERRSVGALRCLRVEVFGLSSAERDELNTPGPAGSDALDESIRSARRLLADRRPHLATRYLHGHFSFKSQERSNAWHEGKSAGLAAATLFFCAALTEARERRRLLPCENVAFTGVVGEEGTVTSVETKSLPLKIRTAFFSPTKTLAVPEKQKKEAEPVLDDLTEEYPYGDLRLIGTRRLRDVFDHRRLTRRTEVSWTSYWARKAWSRKTAIAASAVILALAGALGWRLFGPIDKNPVQAQYTGEMMIVENDTGQEIERFEVGERIVNRQQRDNIKKPVAFADVTGDSKNEVFWAASVDSTSKLAVLRGRAVGADTLLWEKLLQFDVSFPRKPEVVGTTFVPRDLLAADLTGDGQPMLYASLKHTPYFPEMLLQIQPRSGAELQRYLHFGHLTTGLHASDLDADGTGELLTGGHSNAFGDPILAVLNPSNMQGHAPTRGRYTVEGMSRAPHHAYLRFPASQVQEARPKTPPMTQQVEIKRNPT
jgi:hypothetical protein